MWSIIMPRCCLILNIVYGHQILFEFGSCRSSQFSIGILLILCSFSHFLWSFVMPGCCLMPALLRNEHNLCTSNTIRVWIMSVKAKSELCSYGYALVLFIWIYIFPCNFLHMIILFQFVGFSWFTLCVLGFFGYIQVDLLLAFCSKLGFSSVVLVGHDDGGLLSLKAAQRVQESGSSVNVSKLPCFLKIAKNL